MKLTALDNTTLAIYAHDVITKAYYESIPVMLDATVDDVLHRRITEALITVRNVATRLAAQKAAR